MHDETLKL